MAVCGIDEDVAHTHHLDATLFHNPRLCGLFYLYLGTLATPIETYYDYQVLSSPH